ncbi:kinase-like domain-containing protein [Xylariaceae sp. FL0016]|nr:kinase-like domain-containing protein [Xylariaceae sp. FL0016]
MSSIDRDRIASQVREGLENTAFAASSMRVLSGGNANFTYHANLKTPLQDGTKEVLIKQSEGFVANNPDFKLTLARCRIEDECLKALSKFSVSSIKDGTESIYTVRTPRFSHFDEINNTQIQEYLPNSKDLKTYALKTYPENTPDAAREECFQLGRALGLWLRSFHQWGATQPDLYKMVSGNEEMQHLKHVINFSWLVSRIQLFPSILEEARSVFEEVKEMAEKEMRDEGKTQVIHGDFWTGNILLPDSPIEKGVGIPMFVVDWEMSQAGAPNLDVGQMVAELYELKLYKNITAGNWMVQGFLNGYGNVDEEFALRTAIQVGTHLIGFGTSVQGWGTPDQVEMVARTGRDIIVHAWRKDRKWFEEGELACLFESVP